MHSVPKVEMGVDGAGKHGKAGHIDRVARVSATRGGNRGDLAPGDEDIGLLQSDPRQEGNAASQCKIRLLGHGLIPLLLRAA